MWKAAWKPPKESVLILCDTHRELQAMPGWGWNTPVERGLTGWSLSLLCEASPHYRPSFWFSASSQPITWALCNVQLWFFSATCSPAPLPAPLSSPQAVQASTCKRRNRAGPLLAKTIGRSTGCAPRQEYPSLSPPWVVSRPNRLCDTCRGRSDLMVGLLYIWQEGAAISMWIRWNLPGCIMRLTWIL